MAKLSITTAWNETVAFMKRDFGSLFTVAFAFMALPSVALQALGPGEVGPGSQPEPGLWMLLVPVVMVLSIVGTLAISTLALGRENVVGNAIRHGFRRFLPMLGAAILIGILAIIILVPVILITGVRPSDFASPSAGTAGKILLAMLLFLAIGLFFWVRLLMMTPVAAAEAQGPIGIIRRSWALTAGHWGKLLGFVVLLIVVFLVISLVVTMIVGIVIALVAGAPQPGNLSSLLTLLVAGVLNAAFGVVFTAMAARIYVQLAGEPVSDGARTTGI
ncbi:MAG TPA: hypothetical protein VGB59_12240 [Allosphingosinicella sp.]|jgi:hypothetical protein